MNFITENDYDVLIRKEIKGILLENYTDLKLKTAEQMVLAQIKNYLSGFYDCQQIFSQTSNDRNAFIVMITIDCTLYHLYSSLSPNKIPQHRSERYNDALEWLKLIANGTASADLPPKTSENGQVNTNIKISSNYKQVKNKF